MEVSAKISRIPTYNKLTFPSENVAKSAIAKMQEDHPQAIIKQSGNKIFFPKHFSADYAEKIASQFDAIV